MRGLTATANLPAAVATLPSPRDPLELFRVVSRDRLPVVLQSSRREEGTGRFSVVASDPFLVFRFRQRKGLLSSRRLEERVEGDPFLSLRAHLDRFAVPEIPGLPFAGGAIGYLGYGLRRFIEPLGPARTFPSSWPDLILAFYDRGFIVDHQRGCTHLVATGFPETGPHRRLAKQRLDLAQLASRSAAGAEREDRIGNPAPARPVFECSRERYLEAIRRAQDHLAAGEIYQVNLSHRIIVEGNWNPFALYRSLTERHPACFAAYLPYGDHAVLSASPERLVRLTGRRAETRPIKGTRRRAPDPAADDRSARELAASAKERSENVMIVDLARNDLGKVCAAGSVRAEDLCRVESLPSVHHLVSTVSGRLREGCDRIDLVRALFPGGSMTGAPKIRAMEIIDDLEGVERGIYAGSIGYFSFDGGMDLNIVIRTVIVSGRTAILQVGGAILAESNPEAEYEETLDKARPILGLLSDSERD